jgi:hypothetical protein
MLRAVLGSEHAQHRQQKIRDNLISALSQHDLYPDKEVPRYRRAARNRQPNFFEPSADQDPSRAMMP